MINKIFLIIFTFSIFTTQLFAKQITIAVAANVSYAIDTLTKEFNTIYPNTKVRVILGSSGKLTAQISNNAPYDIFMSANMLYPNNLYKNKFAISKPVVYAQGTLALLSTKKQDFTNKINIVLSKNIKRIAMANPKTAPYGIATYEVLQNLKLYSKIKKKLIFGESISQTVSYTMTAANIGFVAKSSLYSSKMGDFKENINWIEIDSSLYTPIDQGIVILKHAKSNDEVKDFYNFILSRKAKDIFNKYGYLKQ